MIIDAGFDVNYMPMPFMERNISTNTTDSVESLVYVELNYPKSPLYVASQYGHSKIVEILLATCADPNGHRNDRMSPLHCACSKGHVTIVELLIAAEADVNLRSIEYGTPLTLALSSGYAKVARILIASGANTSWPDPFGQTPLHVLCRSIGQISITSTAVRDPTTGQHVLIRTGSNFNTLDDEASLKFHEDIFHITGLLIVDSANLEAAWCRATGKTKTVPK